MFTFRFWSCAPSAARSDSVRRPIGLRPPSNQIASAVRSDSERRPIRLRSLPDVEGCVESVSNL